MTPTRRIPSDMHFRRPPGEEDPKIAFISRVRALPLTLRVAAASDALVYIPPEVRVEFGIILLEAVLDFSEGGVQFHPFRALSGWRRASRVEVRLAALRGLVAGWRWLDRPTRRATIAVARPHWAEVVRALVADPRWWARAGVCEAVAEARLVSRAAPLVPLLRDGDTRVASAAEASLSRLVEIARARTCVRYPTDGILRRKGGILARVEEAIRLRERPGRGAIHRLHAELRRAVEEYPGRGRRGAFRLAAQALDPAWLVPEARSELGGWLVDEAAEGHLVLRAVLRRGADPLLGERAIEWLDRSHLAAACLDRIAAPRSSEERGRASGRAHLLLRPARARRARLIERASLPGREEVSRMAPGSRRGLVRLAGAMRLRDSDLDALLLAVEESPDALTRLLCARMGRRSALSRLCFDEHPGVARSAALRWSRVGARAKVDGAARDAENRTLARRLSRSADPVMRRVGEAEGARLGAGVASPAGRVRLRRELLSDREGVLDRLRRALREGEPAEREEAIATCRALGVQREVEIELLGLISALAHAAEGVKAIGERVVSAGAGALGAIDASAADEALRALLAHDAARVRANALEALVRCHRRLGANAPARARAELGSTLWEAKEDPHHRVRGAAARWLLGGVAGDGHRGADPEAIAFLEELLSDRRAMQRVAGLWAVRRGLEGAGAIPPALARLVRQLAREDEEAGVRVRARAVGRWLGLSRVEGEAHA